MSEDEVREYLERMQQLTDAMWPLVPRPLGDIANPLLAVASIAALFGLEIHSQRAEIERLRSQLALAHNTPTLAALLTPHSIERWEEGLDDAGALPAGTEVKR